MLRRILPLLGELGLLLLAVFSADKLETDTDFIPPTLVRLPEVDYSTSDYWVVLIYFLVTHLIVLAIMSLLHGPWRPVDIARTSREFYALALAFGLSSLGLFVTTSIAFDPNFIVGIALLNFSGFLLCFIVGQLLHRTSIFGQMGQLIKQLFSRSVTPFGVFCIVVALSPGILAKMFLADRDFANRVTQMRIFFNSLSEEESSYVLVNAFGGKTFYQPILLKQNPADFTEIFVLERAGRLLRVNDKPDYERSVVLDISAEVGLADIENGALGFAFHPQFGIADNANSGYIYLYYTSVKDGEQTNRLSRFDLRASDSGNVAESELPLMVLPREPSGFHNGGSVEFGPDGFLYLAVGEGVHPRSSHSLSETLRAGILRIDVDKQGGNTSQPISRQPGSGETANYYIPSDNPFIGEDHLMDEYWAIGLRNPYRISFDFDTGQLWAGDVGSTKWEEVNMLTRGGDYQFPAVEGEEETGRSAAHQLSIPSYGPVYTYIHTAYDRAVVGGFIYRGDKFTELQGEYVFADNYSSKILAIPASGSKVDQATHLATANQYAQRGTSSLMQLADGRILVTTLGRGAASTGEVLRLARADELSDSISPATPAPPGLAFTAQEIESLYNTNCSRCHGVEGKGDGPDAGLLNVNIPDFTSKDYQTSRSSQELSQAIRQGGASVGLSPLMPAWEHIMTDVEVEALTDLVRKFAR